jgi:hypothetical protein
MVVGSLSARGGNGGPGYSVGGVGGYSSGGGGGGGGGWIQIQTDDWVLSGSYDLSGGSGGSAGPFSDPADAGFAGQSGAIGFAGLPEPPGIVLGITAVLAGLGWGWVRRRFSRPVWG